MFVAAERDTILGATLSHPVAILKHLDAEVRPGGTLGCSMLRACGRQHVSPALCWEKTLAVLYFSRTFRCARSSCRRAPRGSKSGTSCQKNEGCVCAHLPTCHMHCVPVMTMYVLEHRNRQEEGALQYSCWKRVHPEVLKTVMGSNLLLRGAKEGVSRHVWRGEDGPCSAGLSCHSVVAAVAQFHCRPAHAILDPSLRPLSRLLFVLCTSVAFDAEELGSSAVPRV